MRPKNILKEFKEFAVKGNVVDMGVGIIIGAAFTSVINSLVKDILSPVLSLLTSNVNTANWFWVLKNGNGGGPYITLEQARLDGAITMNLGQFTNALSSFLIASLALFIVIRAINQLRRPQGESEASVKTKVCPHCLSSIPLGAKRCPYCTSQLESSPPTRADHQ